MLIFGTIKTIIVELIIVQTTFINNNIKYLKKYSLVEVSLAVFFCVIELCRYLLINTLSLAAKIKVEVVIVKNGYRAIKQNIIPLIL